MNNLSSLNDNINSLVEVHASVSQHYATKHCEWPHFMDDIHDKLLKVIFDLRQMVSLNSDLLNASIQARAALPDAWSAVECNVPKEVIELLNKAICKAETAGYSSGPVAETKKPILAVTMDGGLIQSVVCNSPDLLQPLDVIIIDYDTEGTDKHELESVPQGDGTVTEAYCRLETISLAEIDLQSVHHQITGVKTTV